MTLDPENADRMASAATSSGNTWGTGVFHREGEYWTISYSGILLRLRDSKGLQHLAELLAHPGQRFAADDLVARNPAPSSESSSAMPAVRTEPSPLRSSISASERARLTVTQRIKAALRKIEAHHPSLAQHFGSCIKTGYTLVYVTDPQQPILWEVR